MAKEYYKIDLHTHSIISHDGAIAEKHYRKLLESGTLDFIAITDHNDICFAEVMQERFGEKIIIGEEISTTDGDLIGLFLKERVAPGKSARKTALEIHYQGGLVYIPHPFETLRKGLSLPVLEGMRGDIDIVEVFNGRALWRGRADEARTFAQKYKYPIASSSDAHCFRGVGSALSIISEPPSSDRLKSLLVRPELKTRYAPVLTLLCPFVNKIRNKLDRSLLVPA